MLRVNSLNGFNAQGGSYVGVFDGVDDYVLLDNTVNATDFLELEILFLTYKITGQQGLINKGESTLNFINYYLEIKDNNLRFVIGDGVNNQQIITSFTINKDEWTRIKVRLDGATIKFYKNNILKETITQTVNLTANSFPLKIGNLSSIYYYFDGVISNIQITTPTKTYKYNFSEGTGNTLHDTGTGTPVNGTIINAQTTTPNISGAFWKRRKYV